MRITALEEYGLRCLLQLARQPEGDSLSLKEIARREGISTANAGKVLWLLSNAGIVRSVRGVKGGYVLARAASEISVGDIIGVLDTEAMDDHCKSFSGAQEVCVHHDDCGIRPVLHTLNQTVHQVLGKITLAHLIHSEGDVNQRLFQLRRIPKTGELEATAFRSSM
ncbi:MAG: Rrf2 family transcriptional regulator [Acidobacteria bacterium]|nr:Rrf2 family transcriptional regulator [Acidobacteriota bacterium]